MWGAFLSEPLRIDGLVVRYTANFLMRRMPIPSRTLRPFLQSRMPGIDIRGIRRRFRRLSPWTGQVAYVLLTRAPVAGRMRERIPRCPSTCMC